MRGRQVRIHCMHKLRLHTPAAFAVGLLGGSVSDVALAAREAFLGGSESNARHEASSDDQNRETEHNPNGLYRMYQTLYGTGGSKNGLLVILKQILKKSCCTDVKLRIPELISAEHRGDEEFQQSLRICFRTFLRKI